VAFIDETGNSFRARVASTWARRGQPPVLHRRDKRREVSSIACLLAPSRKVRRARLYARHIHGSFDSDDVVRGLIYFRRKAGQPLLVVWDRLNQHRSRRTLDFISRHPEDFHLEWLPAYAPDLNPEEGCNSVVKSELRNATPDTDEQLRAQARAAFRRLARRSDVLAGFFKHAGLRLTGLT
jgi:transposase